MFTPGVEARQKFACPGGDVGRLIIVAGKGTNRIDRVKAGNGRELYFRTHLAAHDPCPAVTRNGVNLDRSINWLGMSSAHMLVDSYSPVEQKIYMYLHLQDFPSAVLFRSGYEKVYQKVINSLFMLAESLWGVESLA